MPGLIKLVLVVEDRYDDLERLERMNVIRGSTKVHLMFADNVMVAQWLLMKYGNELSVVVLDGNVPKDPVDFGQSGLTTLPLVEMITRQFPHIHIISSSGNPHWNDLLQEAGAHESFDKYPPGFELVLEDRAHGRMSETTAK